MDYSLPGSSVHGILQTRILEWVAFPSRDLPNPGIKTRSPALQQIPHHLSHQGSPRILQWVAYSFSRGSSQPRNQSRVFCISGRFFTSWATRESPIPICTCAKSLQLCPTFCNPMDFATLWTVACQATQSMDILQARILEWVAMTSSSGSSWPRDWTCVSYGSCSEGGFFTTELPGKTPIPIWALPITLFSYILFNVSL